MPRFAANLTLMFNEVDFLDRFAAAAEAGFPAVECQLPYAWSAADIAARLRNNGLTQALINLPAGDWAAGDRGIACDPARVEEFRKGVPRALEYAAALDCTRINCLAGIIPANVTPEQARTTLVENLRFAASELERSGVRLMFEPVNSRDIPGFLVTGSRQALAIMDDVGSDNLYLQYDVYHMQIMEGDLARTLEDNIGRLGHVQIADNPGRHEPGTGEINFDFLFAHLDRIGFDGWVGCEYKPATTTTAGLDWFRAVR